MTSIATMMAAIPPALGFGAGSETRAPMAIAVIGGLIVSTALSLLVVPASTSSPTAPKPPSPAAARRRTWSPKRSRLSADRSERRGEPALGPALAG